MSSTNDNLDLSRSNAKSNGKAVFSDLGAPKVKSYDSRAIPKYFYHNGDDGIAYNTVDEIAQWLLDRPDAIDGFQQSMLDLAVGCSHWGAFRTMRDILNRLVDVRIRIAELRHEEHLA
jgi:hypothetical protein